MPLRNQWSCKIEEEKENSWTGWCLFVWDVLHVADSFLIAYKVRQAQATTVLAPRDHGQVRCERGSRIGALGSIRLSLEV